MNDPLPDFRFLERIALPAPLGIIFWDVATASPVRDGLVVSVALKARPQLTRPLEVNPSGVWFAPALPGRSAAELASGDWTALRRTYRVEVADTSGRFLPLAFDAELPSRGLYNWPGWSASPPLPLADLAPLTEDSPPRVSPDRIPLFSAAARTGSPVIADVRCQLADATTGRPAAWALVTASHAGRTRGIGLADREGRAAIFFDYPERPRPMIVTSPPAITHFRWDLEICGFYNPGSGPVPDVPDLTDVVAQLAHPREPLDSTLSPPEPLPSQLLTFGHPLVMRTSRTAQGASSVLFLGPG